MGNDTLFLDFETQSSVDIKKCGADVYARDPSTKVLCCGFAFNEEPAQIASPSNIERIKDHLYGGGKVIAHNAHFEWLILNYVWTIPVPITQFKCTMAMSFAMSLPGSLENAAAAVGLDSQKDLKGRRVMLQLSTPKIDGTFWRQDEVPEKFKQLFEYCKTDVEVERKLFKKLLPLSKSEEELWFLDHTINQRGVKTNQKALATAQSLLEERKQILDKKIRKLTSNQVASCSAVSQLTDWLKDQGVECDGVAKADLDSLLKQKDLSPVVREVLEIRRSAAKSSTAKISSLILGADKDERIRGLFQYHGAATGRWAGRRTQLQNLPRSKISHEQLEGFFKILEGF